MSDFNLVGRYPDGTSVSAYPVSNWDGGVANKRLPPVGPASDTQVMVDGQLTFTGLDPFRYVAYAEVEGAHRYIDFQPGQDENPTNLVTPAQHRALAGTAGMPDSDNRYVTDEDPRFVGVPRLLAEGQLSSTDVFYNDESKEIGPAVPFTTTGPVVITFAALIDVDVGALDLWLRLDGFGLFNHHLAEIDVSVGPDPYFWRIPINTEPGAHGATIFGIAAGNQATVHVDSTEQWSTVLSVWSNPTGFAGAFP